jgi:hypothetical protein
VLSGATAYKKQPCGPAWVASSVTGKPSQVSTAVCQPCSSIEVSGITSSFCPASGRLTPAAHIMCVGDPCVEATDASTCCACQYEDGTSTNAAACACGSANTPVFCSANEYCNAENKLCSSHPIPSCANIGGIEHNPSSCACGTADCENDSTSGLYCSKKDNRCRKYSVCETGDGSDANSAACACGANDCEDVTELFCYSPRGLCSSSNMFASGSITASPVCDPTDGSAKHISSDKCFCGASPSGVCNKNDYCYSPKSICTAEADPDWVDDCTFKTNEDKNTQGCTCGVAVCEPAVNGPYCFQSDSRW